MKKNWIISLVLSLSLTAMLILTGCTGGVAVKDGDTVLVDYTGTLSDGTVFDSSLNEGREPLEFTLGAGSTISGFEDAVLGMKVGETKTVTIPAAEAYGEITTENTIEIPLSDLPEGVEPEVGVELQNSMYIFTITAVNEASVTAYYNHLLAGYDLTFEIELVEIVSE